MIHKCFQHIYTFMGASVVFSKALLQFTKDFFYVKTFKTSIVRQRPFFSRPIEAQFKGNNPQGNSHQGKDCKNQYLSFDLRDRIMIGQSLS